MRRCDVCMTWGVSRLPIGPLDDRTCVRGVVRMGSSGLLIYRYLRLFGSCKRDNWAEVHSGRQYRHWQTSVSKSVCWQAPGGLMKPVFVKTITPSPSIEETTTTTGTSETCACGDAECCGYSSSILLGELAVDMSRWCQPKSNCEFQGDTLYWYKWPPKLVIIHNKWNNLLG